MKKWIVPALVVAAALVAWAVVSQGRGAKTEYRFVEVTRGDLQSVVSSTGTLQATTTVEVGTQVSGKIAEIYADFNDHVKRDQLIARIDPLLLQQAVSSAQADVERSQAELDQARRDFDRISRLYERKVSTETEYNTAQYKYQVAQASLKSSRISLERARQNLAYTEIRAPIDGVIVDRTVDVGQTVAASFSAPQLFLIAQDLSAMEILAAVDESDIGQIEQGQVVEFTVQAYPEEKFTGSVQQIRLKSTSQENVVNYTVVVSVENPDGRLLPGMTATVEFIISRATDVLKVPNAALRFRPTEEMQAALREQWRARMGADGARAPGEGRDAANAQGAASGATQSRTESGERGADRALLWYLDGGKPVAMRVKTGITDDQATEVSGPELKEGLQIIAAVASGAAASSATNPFDNRQQQRGPGGPPRFF